MEALNALHEFTGVKALVEKGQDRLPCRFIRPLEEQPGLYSDDVEDENIPLIDLEGHVLDPLSPNVVEAIGRACHEWGCFQVVNHGIAASTMNEMMEAAREFFALAEEEKMKHFTLDTSSKFRYASSFNLHKDKVVSWRDFIRVSCHPLHDVISDWPQNPPTFRKASVNFCTEIQEVVKKICGAVSQSLGLPENYTQREFSEHSQDDVGGLQAFHGGHWVTVKPIRNALVINLGDVLQIVSNGKYKSVEHRAVVNGSRDRLSVLATYGPSLNTIIRPAPDLLALKGSEAVYREILYKDYMQRILNGSLEDKRLADFHSLEIQKN